MEAKKNDILFWFGILTAIWFAWLGMIWMYFTALFIAYPVGLLSLLIWLKIRHENKSRNKYIPLILIIGVILSLSTLIYLLVFD